MDFPNNWTSERIKHKRIDFALDLAAVGLDLESIRKMVGFTKVEWEAVLNEDEQLRYDLELGRVEPIIRALSTINKKIGSDPKIAQWYLERLVGLTPESDSVTSPKTNVNVNILNRPEFVKKTKEIKGKFEEELLQTYKKAAKREKTLQEIEDGKI